MKIWDNGVVRDMTPEEIKATEEAEEEIANLIPPEDDKTIMEELIDRLANVNTLEEVKEIAKDIKERI
jgi:hypothetical protein